MADDKVTIGIYQLIKCFPNAETASTHILKHDASRKAQSVRLAGVWNASRHASWLGISGF